MILSYIGLAIFIIGGIGTLVAAFRVSFWWFLGCLVFSPISLLFLILHWQDAINPLVLQILGFVLVLIGNHFSLPTHKLLNP